jgi:2-iminoacetate synthase
MKFTPEKYALPDERMLPFIDPAEIWEYLNRTHPSGEKVRAIIAKSLSKQRLNLEEVACLINADDPALIQEIKEGARTLKRTIYGNRIVLFAPLYIGNKCSNDCTYCGFRSSNADAVRKTLSPEDIVHEVESLEDQGQKRLILVFGEHAQYDAEFIAASVRTAYAVKKGKGEIRRVNINAAPLDIEDFEVVKQAGIGTFQVFQETYHPEAYKTYHLRGKKADYNYRLTALDRAQEAGIDDVGIGVLFGMGDACHGYTLRLSPVAASNRWHLSSAMPSGICIEAKARKNADVSQPRLPAERCRSSASSGASAALTERKA